MIRKIFRQSTAVAVLLLAVTHGSADAAGEPITLTDVQMDRIAAGGATLVSNGDKFLFRSHNGAAVVFHDNPKQPGNVGFNEVMTPGQESFRETDSYTTHTVIVTPPDH